MTTGIAPEAGPRLIDGTFVNGLADGANRSVVGPLVAHAGGTKAAALILSSGVAMIAFGTVATNSDSGLMPEAVAGNLVLVANRGAATLSLYGKGDNTINGAATANAYDLTTGLSALFFCVVDGAWEVIKSA